MVRKRRWTLRTWLILPAAAVVTVLCATSALLQTDTLVRAWLSSTRQLSELAARQVTEYILLRLENTDGELIPSGKTRQEQRQSWLSRIDNDEKLAGLLESSGAGANSIAEISITDEKGIVLASSNRARPGSPAASAQPLISLQKLDPWKRVRAVWAPGSEYELQVPVGLSGDSAPLFVVQVLVSNALLRETLSPGIRRIVLTGSLAYAVALLLVVVSAEVTRMNLRRIGKLIDRIGQGQSIQGETRPAGGTAEFDAVESKLALMEGRVRGALHEAKDYRQRVGALLHGLEQAVLLFEGEKVVLVAGAVDNLLGWSAEDVNGKSVGELFPPNAPLTKLIRTSWESGQIVENGETEWGETDPPRRLLVNIDYIVDHASPVRTLTLLRLRDAEGATKVESELQVASRLEAISRLTGGVAHEIKNPLNAIAARVALLEAIVEGNPEAENEIRVVADEIQRLDRVVRTFLDFAQPLHVMREETDLVELAGSVVSLIRPDAENRGIAVTFDKSAQHLIARGDRDLLRQALLNIVVNAVEATPSGGAVRVAASTCDRYCRLIVTDTGPGIPETVRDKIFQLYFTTKTGGSGIGLAVAYRSLQLHGGDIHIETEVGKGTTFELMIPAQQKEVSAAA